MKCSEIRQNKLNITDRSEKKPEKGEVLIKVHYAGINRDDITQRKEYLNTINGQALIPGFEVAGEVVEIARGANAKRNGMKHLKKGDKVIALLNNGGYAEYCCVTAEHCLHIPKEMTFAEAATIPYTFITVWKNLVHLAKLKAGETLLLHGGTSGIGTTAIQIAKYLGAKVIVTASNDEKCKLCSKLGADASINHQTKDFVKIVDKETKHKGVDVVLDMIGGDYASRNFETLKKGGRYITIAAMHGSDIDISLKEVMEKELVITGSLIGNMSDEEKTKIIQELQKNIMPLMGKRGFFSKMFGKKNITPVIAKEFLLSDAQAAHDYLDTGIHFGKAVLRII